jgi:hypothetical protein
VSAGAAEFLLAQRHRHGASHRETPSDLRILVFLTSSQSTNTKPNSIPLNNRTNYFRFFHRPKFNPQSSSSENFKLQQQKFLKCTTVNELQIFRIVTSIQTKIHRKKQLLHKKAKINQTEKTLEKNQTIPRLTTLSKRTQTDRKNPNPCFSDSVTEFHFLKFSYVSSCYLNSCTRLKTSSEWRVLYTQYRESIYVIRHTSSQRNRCPPFCR